MFDAEPAGLGLFMTPSEQAILHTNESIVTAKNGLNINIYLQLYNHRLNNDYLWLKFICYKDFLMSSFH